MKSTNLLWNWILSFFLDIYGFTVKFFTSKLIYLYVFKKNWFIYLLRTIIAKAFETHVLVTLNLVNYVWDSYPTCRKTMIIYVTIQP
jgi:hypothetical protein